MATAHPPLTEKQRAREKSLVFAMLWDGGFMFVMLAAGVVGGSLTLIAECVRGCLMLGTEVFSFLVLRRIHRGQLADLEFGAGKLEQVANLGIASGMILGAGWIMANVFSLIRAAGEPGSPLGLVATAMVGAANVYVNFITWVEVRHAAKVSPSVIMSAQLRARAVKLFSSGFVLIVLTLAAMSTDPVIARWCDVVGGTFVATMLVRAALALFRGGLPDLLDRSVDEAAQRGINRALAAQFDVYDSLGQVRSRCSGSRVFIEVPVGFAADLPLAEVDRRSRSLQEALEREVAGAEVAILVSAVPRAADA